MPSGFFDDLKKAAKGALDKVEDAIDKVGDAVEKTVEDVFKKDKEVVV